MSRTQKVVLVGLALMALLFVALIVWGQTRPACRGTARECADGYQPGDAVKAMGRLFSGAGSHVKLAEKKFVFSAAGSRDVDIARNSDGGDRMRTLKLRQVKGVFRLKLVNVVKDPNLADQEDASPLPREASTPQDMRTQSFAVTSGGGRLTIECVTAPCELEAE